MRIEGPRRSDSVSKSGKTKKSTESSGDFRTLLDGGADAASGPSGASGVSDVSALLAAQAAEDPTERKARKRMVARAQDVLGALDGVHRDLVSGGVTLDRMRDVSARVSAQREKVADPQLAELLDHIDLRARVELAKLEMSYEKNKK